MYEGVGFEGKICGVSILRAGEVGVFPEHETSFRSILRIGYGSRFAGSMPKCTDREDSYPESELPMSRRVGESITSSQDEETAQAKLFYAKVRNERHKTPFKS